MKEQDALGAGIDLESLKKEQGELASRVSLRDSLNFKGILNFGAIRTEKIDKEILAAVVVCNENFDVIEEAYALRRPRFPYIPGYRAYRELPIMMLAYKKIKENADVFLIEGHGIAHPRFCGLATHFGLETGKPSIGITKALLIGEVKGNSVFIKNKEVAQKVVTKEGSKPIFVSPGHNISLKTAIELVKKAVIEPHKLPEPLVKARKFASTIVREFSKNKKE